MCEKCNLDQTGTKAVLAKRMTACRLASDMKRARQYAEQEASSQASSAPTQAPGSPPKDSADAADVDQPEAVHTADAAEVDQPEAVHRAGATDVDQPEAVHTADAADAVAPPTPDSSSVSSTAPEAHAEVPEAQPEVQAASQAEQPSSGAAAASTAGAHADVRIPVELTSADRRRAVAQVLGEGKPKASIPWVRPPYTSSNRGPGQM